MARLEQIEGLMEQLGPVLDPLNVTAFPAEKAWGVQVDDDTAVLVDLDEEQGKLVLSCEIGAPPASDRLKLYELLLRHNYQWDATGGSRMALDGEGGKVVLIFDLPTEELDVTRLSAVMEKFTDAARSWREIIARPASDAAPAAPDFSDQTIFRA